MKNAISWFEIPVTDFERAKSFYENIYEVKMEPMEAMGMQSAFFPADLENGIGGCIIKGDGYEPSAKGGVLVYLNGGDDLNTVLSRIEQAGGKVLLAKTGIGPHGFMAHFQDTEGNHLALHSFA